MIVRRIVQTVIAIAVMAAAAGVVVVSASFAVYTLLREFLGPAGAGAVIAATFAVVLVLVGVIFLRGAQRKPAATASPRPSVSASSRIFDLLRQRPVAAAGAAVAAGLIAWRNPALVAILMRAFEQRSDPDDTRRR